MTSNKIERLPAPPKAIIEAVNNGTLAVFIGAGVSRLIGCKGWDELAGNLVEKCFKTRGEDGDPLISYKERDTLSQIKDHKQTITICHYIFSKHGQESIFYSELEAALKAEDQLLDTKNIYKELIGLHGIFITTNADTYFDTKFRPDQISYEDFKPDRIGRNRLFHIHGSIVDKSSLVFTVPQYFNRYRSKDFEHFLMRIFDNYYVLFVGYGMDEFELLDFIIPRFSSEGKKVIERFILLPFYRGEENILEYQQSYYAHMGISVIGYEKDQLGYFQLYEVIKYWNSEINQLSTYLYDSYQFLEDAANNFAHNKLSDVLQMIKNDEPQRNHFLIKLALSDNPFLWLDYLIQEGYFRPENNPPPEEVMGKEGLYNIPYWNILGYLENIANKNEITPSEEITEQIISIIDPIIDYKDENSKRIENFKTDRSVIKLIATLQKERISDKHIEFIRVSINSRWNVKLVDAEIGEIVLPKLIRKEAKEQILKVLEVLLDYQAEKTTTDELKSLVDEYWLNDALGKHKPSIAELCGIEAAGITLDKMVAITNTNKIHFNNIWIPTIEDHPQTDLPDRYECQLVHFVRDMLALSKPSQTREIVKSLINKEHPIFKRIAIHIINCYYEDLNELFWSWTGNPLDDKGVAHELYEILKNHCVQFTAEEIKTVLGWIESKEYTVSSNVKDAQQREKILAYRKKEWLLALLASGNVEVLSAYRKYDAIEPAEPSHPGFDIWKETSWGWRKPQIIEPELIGKTNAELAEYLSNFKGTAGWEDPTLDDLVEQFKACVSNNPARFSSNLEPFLKVGHIFNHSLLRGLCEAWNAGHVYPWDGILEFIMNMIQSEGFWREETKEAGYQYRNQVIWQIADLIRGGTKDDSHAFDDSLLPQAESILLILAKQTESTVTDTEGVMNAVLNSAKGQVFSAMVVYSLRCYRLSRKAGEAYWVKGIKDDFNRRLDSPETSIEFLTTIGEYLPYLYTLDKAWVLDNIDRIFPIENLNNWIAAFTGYLFSLRQVHKDLYLLLRERGHYNKALEIVFSDRHVTERIVDHICVGYLEEWEKLEDVNSLISKLIQKDNIDQISEVVTFFWIQREKVSENIKRKIKPLWKTLLDKAVEHEDQPEHQKIISDLCKWLSLVDQIDDQIFEWLKLSAKYIEVGYNSPFFVEYLLLHTVSNPFEVGKVYLEMLNAGIYPEYKRENIQQILETLYDKGQKETADRICTLYLSKGITFLQHIYEKHR